MPDIPSIREFFWPILRVLAEVEGTIARRDFQERAAGLMDLTPDQKAVRTANGIPKYRHRAGWATSSLKHAGLVNNPEPGRWALTDEGRRFVAAHPSGLSDESIRDILRRARQSMRNASDEGGDELALVDADTQDSASPEEQIDQALAALRESVAADLLHRLANADPTFFEGVVLDVLHAMGYGASREDLQRVGGSGDGGIDGIVSLDRLGLEKVYVQAKRWQANVGRPEIQGFFGALSGRRANKGVFITTAGYTREARDFAASVSDTLILVNGRELANLMIEYGVGVTRRPLHLPELDSDYFTED